MVTATFGMVAAAQAVEALWAPAARAAQKSRL
jgi:tRNA A37 threonylcarbamoyladenosine dehydratase